MHVDVGGTVTSVGVDGDFFVDTDNSSDSDAGTIRAADFDGDGSIDVLTAYNAHMLRYINDGTGGFGAPPIEDGTGQFVELVDVDHDSDIDILATAGTGPIATGINDGAGNFDWSESASAAGRLYGAGDFDGDGHHDVVTYAVSDERLVYFAGGGDGSFTPMSDIDLTLDWTSAAVLDADGDGDDDLGLIAQESAAILLSEGGTPILHVIETEFELEPSDVAAGDIDGDGVDELLFAFGDFDADETTIAVVSCAR